MSILIITFLNTKDTIIRVIIGLAKYWQNLIMFNQSNKISENNTAVLIRTFLNTKDTIIRVIMGLVKQWQNLYLFNQSHKISENNNFNPYNNIFKH